MWYQKHCKNRSKKVAKIVVSDTNTIAIIAILMQNYCNVIAKTL